jgi:hypothetical protein
MIAVIRKVIQSLAVGCVERHLKAYGLARVMATVFIFYASRVRQW